MKTVSSERVSLWPWAWSCDRVLRAAYGDVHAVWVFSRCALLPRLLGTSRVWICRSAADDCGAGLVDASYDWDLTTGAVVLARARGGIADRFDGGVARELRVKHWR